MYLTLIYLVQVTMFPSGIIVLVLSILLCIIHEILG